MPQQRTASYALSLIILLASCLPTVPVAAQENGAGNGVLVRVEGDVALGPEADLDVIVVVDGALTLEGAAEVIVLVDGTATLLNARVDELVAVNGDVALQKNTVVTGNVHLVGAGFSQEESALVRGEIRRDAYVRFAQGLFVFGLLFAIGYAVAVVLGGLVFAAIAARGVRRAGAAISNEIGTTLIAALIIWVGLPIVAFIAFATLVGIPTGLGILIIVLPALGFLGYLTFGIWLGDSVLERTRGTIEPEHPYLAALVGTGLLIVTGVIPVVGPVITPVASFIGSGALGLLAWRATQWGNAARAPAPETPP